MMFPRWWRFKSWSSGLWSSGWGRRQHVPPTTSLHDVTTKNTPTYMRILVSSFICGNSDCTGDVCCVGQPEGGLLLYMKCDFLYNIHSGHAVWAPYRIQKATCWEPLDNIKESTDDAADSDGLRITNAFIYCDTVGITAWNRSRGPNNWNEFFPQSPETKVTCFLTPWRKEDACKTCLPLCSFVRSFVYVFP